MVRLKIRKVLTFESISSTWTEDQIHYAARHLKQHKVIRIGNSGLLEIRGGGHLFGSSCAERPHEHGHRNTVGMRGQT